MKLFKKKQDVPEYNSNQEAIFDINDISNILPHKDPFLLVDKIVELSENHVVGIKNVTRNEEFFNGHFPGNPVIGASSRSYGSNGRNNDSSNWIQKCMTLTS